MKIRNLNKSIPVLLLTAALLVGTSVAYQTDFDMKTNRFSVGNVTTEIKEEFPDPDPITPNGDKTYSKKVWVTNPASGQNASNTSCYVRVSIGYSNSDIGKSVQLNGLDTTNWVKSSDGFYYYKNILGTGEQTTPLMTGFTVKTSEIPKEYLSLVSKFELQIYEESVQAEGYADYASAWKAFDTSV